MPDETVKMRVINRYRGSESSLFPAGDGGVPDGAVIYVTPQRSRELIALGNAVPIIGPAETKILRRAEAPGKSEDETDGSAEPSSSSPAAQASPETTATKSPAAKKTRAGAASR